MTISNRHRELKLLRKFLFVCGMPLRCAISLFIPMQDEGLYSASQTVVELSAIDAPTRKLWVNPGVVYTLPAAGFGGGVWQSEN